MTLKKPPKTPKITIIDNCQIIIVKSYIKHIKASASTPHYLGIISERQPMIFEFGVIYLWITFKNEIFKSQDVWGSF